MEKRYFLPWEWKERRNFLDDQDRKRVNGILQWENSKRSPAETKRINTIQHKKAIRHYEASGVSMLIDDMFIDVVGFQKVIVGDKPYENEDKYGEYFSDEVVVKLLWNKEGWSEDWGNVMKIVVFPDGDISFFGGNEGKSFLKYDEWSGNQQLGKNILSSALGKSFKNPDFDLRSFYLNQ